MAKLLTILIAPELIDPSTKANIGGRDLSAEETHDGKACKAGGTLKDVPESWYNDRAHWPFLSVQKIKHVKTAKPDQRDIDGYRAALADANKENERLTIELADHSERLTELENATKSKGGQKLLDDNAALTAQVAELTAENEALKAQVEELSAVSEDAAPEGDEDAPPEGDEDAPPEGDEDAPPEGDEPPVVPKATKSKTKKK